MMVHIVNECFLNLVHVVDGVLTAVNTLCSYFTEPLPVTRQFWITEQIYIFANM